MTFSPSEMEYRTIKGRDLAVVRGNNGKIVKVYSGPIAKAKWNKMFNLNFI